MRKLNIDEWNRKDQFYYFKDYENPFYNICTELNISEFLTYIKKRKIPFSTAILYASLRVVNEYEPFKYRIIDDEVIIFDEIHGGQTVLNSDDTFSFCYFKYYDNFHDFFENVRSVLNEHHQREKKLDPRTNQNDLIHYSTLPWIKFTSVSHARKFSRRDSIPKMVFGKFYKDDGSYTMPFSVEVHHSLIDGLHIAEYLEKFQNYLEHPATLLS